MDKKDYLKGVPPVGGELSKEKIPSRSPGKLRGLSTAV